MSSLELSDGTIIPSHLGTRTPDVPQDTGTHSNMTLRFGEVIEIQYPEDSGANQVQYKVKIFQGDGTNAIVTTTYFAVPVSNMFGGVADYTKWTLRADPQKTQVLGKGSKVLILCINGRKTSAIILGGIHDPNANDDTQDDKHHYEFNFNGANISVNDDGEYTVTYTGASDIDGNTRSGVDTSKVGGLLLLDKDGNFQVTVPNNIILKSEQGTLIGDATDNMLLGSTYRQNEITLHNQLVTNLNILAGILSTTAAALISAGSTAPAGIALQGAVPILTQMATAITDFESLADDFLSKNNKSD